MKTELEYANELIDYYHNLLFINIDNHFEKFRHPKAIQCAMQDVENTIEALELITLTLDNHSIVKYYRNVLQILKDKL